MKVFRLFSLALLGVVLSLVIAFCGQEDIEPDGGGKTEHPNGIPSKIPNNIIYYITTDDSRIRFDNEDVFGGAKIVSNTYSSTKGYGTIEFASEVTAIENRAFVEEKTLQYIALPNSVESIGEYAFGDCSGLKEIKVEEGNPVYDSRENCNAIIETASNTLVLGRQTTIIPNSVTSIGKYAFYGCFGLTSIIIPNSVKRIGDYAFYGCFGLTSVTIGNSVTSIGDYAFSDCSGLTSVTIGNSVTSIGDYAFRSCSGLTSVTIGNSVESIGDAAFYACSGLTSVTIGNSVTSIGDNAFRECFGLTSIIIPNSVESIGDYAFSDCSGLKEIKVEEGNPVYDSRGNCNAIIETASNTLVLGRQTTIIPNSVTSIGYLAFVGCSGLTSVTIPNSVESIGDFAFQGCSGLTSIIIPNSVESIGENAFGGCSALTTVAIPNSVESIGYGAFDGCSGLTSVTIGNSVKSIGDEAFQGCSGLMDVYCYAENPPSIYDYTFYGIPSDATLRVPAASVERYNSWRDLFFRIVAL